MRALTRLQCRRAVRRLVQGGVDALVAFAAFWIAVSVTAPPVAADVALPLAAFVASLRVSVAFLFRCYRQLWRHTSLQEVLRLTAACAVGSTLLLGLSLLALWPVPPLAVGLDLVLCLAGTVAARTLRRLAVHRVRPAAAAPRAPGAATLLIGAGPTASLMVREVQRHRLPLPIAGILDDDPAVAGAEVHGVEVLGGLDRLSWVLDHHDIGQVVVTDAGLPPDRVRWILGEARQRSLRARVVPELCHFADGSVNLGASRFRLGDLLGTKELPHEWSHRLDRDRARTVLVTGGAGYIGSHLVSILLDRGFRVRVLDNFSYGRAGLEHLRDHPDLEVVEGDIADIRDVVRCVKDAGTVVALAAIVGDPACSHDPEGTLNLNYESTKVLVETARFYGVRRFVFASSCSVYGAGGEGLLTEDSPLRPVSLYARTRIMSEEVVRESCGDMQPVILRLSTVFGYSPRMRYDLVVNTLTVRGLVDGRFQIFGGQQWRPFIHCRDVARAFAAAVTASAEAVRPVVFNVGGDDMNYTLTEVGELVHEQVPAARVQQSSEDVDARNYRVSFARIRDHLGFRPQVSLQNGIAEMVARIEAEPRLREYGDPVFSNLATLQLGPAGTAAASCAAGAPRPAARPQSGGATAASAG